MNVIEYVCEYPGCKEEVAKEVGYDDSMLVCAGHYNEEKTFKAPLELKSEKIEEVLGDLQKLKYALNTVKSLVLLASEELVEKLLDSASKLLKEFSEQQDRINRIMNQVILKKRIFSKVLDNIKENLSIPQISKQEISCNLLSFVYKEFILDKHSGLASLKSRMPYEPEKIIDVRLLSSQTPVSVKLEILSTTNLFIAQQPLTVSESLKALKVQSAILDSPTILQLCLNKGILLTSHNKNSISIWQFENCLNPLKTIELSSDTSQKVINIQQTSKNQALITTNTSFHLMDLQKIEINKNFFHNKGLVQVIKTISNEKVVIGTFSGTLDIFNHNIFQFECSKTLFNADGIGPFRALDCSDKIVVAGGRDGYLKVWYFSEGFFCNLGAHAGEITAIAISKNNHFIITAGDDKYIMLWARQIYSFNMVWKKKHPNLTLYLQISNDTSLLLISTKKALFLSNLSKLVPIQLKPSQLFLLYNHFPDVQASLNPTYNAT